MNRKIKAKLRKAKIIDNHVHLNISSKSEAKVENLLVSMEKNKIDFAIALAAYFPRKSGSISNNEILSLTRQYENVLVFGSLDVEHDLEKGARELGNLLNLEKIFGIKIYPGYQFIYPNDKKLDKVYELALKFGVPVMFHSGLVYRNTGKMKYTDPYFIDEVATDFPDLRIIVSHLGDPLISKTVAVAHKNPNVWLDMSGLISNTTKGRNRQEKWRRLNVELMKKKITEAIIELAGVEKIIFGTDWPISSHEAYIALVKSLKEELDLNRKEEKQMMSGNILKVLGIKN